MRKTHHRLPDAGPPQYRHIAADPSSAISQENRAQLLIFKLALRYIIYPSSDGRVKSPYSRGEGGRGMCSPHCRMVK